MVLGCLGDYELDKSYLESHEFARSIFSPKLNNRNIRI